jgi:hypothetical protein
MCINRVQIDKPGDGRMQNVSNLHSYSDVKRTVHVFVHFIDCYYF